MRLTLHTDYGLRILVYLTSMPGRVVTTTEIGDAYGISKNHLVRVAHSLRAGGFIELTTGRTGGLTLARPAETIRVGEVVRALEPEMRMVECFDRSTNTCPISPRCALSGVIASALDTFLAKLDRHTIGDVVARSGPTLSSYFIPSAALLRKQRKSEVTTAPIARASGAKRAVKRAPSAGLARTSRARRRRIG